MALVSSALAGGLLKKLILSFVTGAISVSTLSLTAERFGSKLAGILGGFPSTLAASLFFIGLIKGPIEASDAAVVVPLMMGIYGVQLSLYCALLDRGIIPALVLSISVWVLLSLVPFFAGSPPLGISILLFFALFAGSVFFVEYRLDTPSARGGRVDLRLMQMISRIMCGGLLVAGSVYLGAIGGPLLGGMMAAFPAVTVATLVVTYQNGGASFSRAMAKSMLLSGMLNVTTYSVGVYYFYPLLGVIGGTIAAFCGIIVSGAATYLIAKTTMR